VRRSFDGSAATLEDVVDHDNAQFSLGLLGHGRADPVAFVKAL